MLRNSGVSKKAKSALFNQYALKQLSLLLFRLGDGRQEGGGDGRGGGGGRGGGRGGGGGGAGGGEVFEMVEEGSGEVVSLTLREYVLGVLSELCTSFQTGVCYRSKEALVGTERWVYYMYQHTHTYSIARCFCGSICLRICKKKLQ